MKKGHWMPIDVRVASLLYNMKRPFTEVEALLSLSADINNKKKGTINGYAALWRWSRCKVRRFINTLQSGDDYLLDRRKTGHKTGMRHAIRLVFNSLQTDSDR